jgi:DNA-directed RNA polymerase beta subunit
MVKSKKAEVDETKVAAEKNTTKKPSKAKVVENYDLPTWDILDAFFMQGGDTDCTNNIVRHQIESFNEFIDKQLIQIIQGFNPIQVCHNYNQEIGNFKYKIFLNILKPSLAKPMYQMTDGTQMLMTPHLARMNNLTYASNLYVDIHVITDVINDDNVTERKENTLTGVCIGKIPIMVRSKACVLSQMPGIAEGEGDHECRYDYGGYFLINGNEKVVISQDRISENKTLVFAPNGNGDGLYAEIRSMPDGMFLPPKTTSLHLSGKSNHMGNIIRLSASFLRAEVPLFVMFRALGIESDKEIYAHIVLDLDAPKQQRMLTQLAACSEDACDIHTQKDALTCLLKILGTTGTPKEFLDQPERAFDILKNTIKNDFLSHTGASFKKKALYLGYMVRKLLSIHLGYLDFDNRDSYLHKRIDTPGILFSNLFRQCYGKLIKEVRNLVVRELNLWRASTNVPLQLINQNNVHRFFKQGLIETGLRYALSTGNWGVKSIGSFQNIRQGVAQVLNRMSYLSTLSHLRRINTPMEKNGKLVQPRKLENSQYGMICPSECFDPETPILLWNGNIVKAQDIIVGDYLIDDNGNSIKVKSTCSGYKIMYEIIPTKKNFINYTVTDNHILTLKVKKYKSIRNHRGKKEFMWFDKKTLSYNYKDFKDEAELHVFESSLDNDNIIDITIETYLSLPINVKKNLYTFKSSGIHWESKEVALDPYILGMWLGDGLSCGYGFVTADKELLDKWIEWGVDNDATIKKGIKYKYHISSTINNTQPGIACNKTEKAPLKKLLAKYNLVKNKHIPLDYLVNDRKTRLAVLAGLIDTDGSVRANGHEIRITQGEPNYKIIYDTEFLARSLGFSCHVNEGICSYTVNGEKRHKPYKELSITGQYLYEIPTVLPRKKLNKFDNPIFEKRGSSFLQSSFILVQKDVQPFVGWQVEGNGRFLLGDMSITHNTPEGSAVGLVKNIALSTHITVNVSSAFVRETLMELGTELYGDHVTDSLAFLKRMGAENSVHIMMNGDIIGFHTEPEQLYTQLKHLKRYGSIPPTTAIIWDVQKSLISLSTEAGRMLRPLYVVDPAESDDNTHFPQLRLFNILRKTGMSWKEFHAHFTSFQSFVAPMIDDTGEGFIEYMDVDEIDKAMVAMLPAHLKRTIKGTTLPPKFTHCEIEPSLLNGVLAANIPFMDHNQAPRNCYQCLNSDELVLLISGEARPIKDIAVGDNVYCFNLQNGNLEPTKVIHQYSQLANKPMRHIFTMSGRRIIATNDHKFQTTEGWKAETDFNGATQLFIHPYPISYPHTLKSDSVTDIIINDSMIYKTILTELQTYGLADINALHSKLPIIARLAGYMHACNPLKFPSQLDEARFNEDIRSLGFVDGAQDRSFAVFMSGLDAIMQVPGWVAHGTQLVQREYINGIFGGYINSGFKSIMTILSEDIIDIVSQFASVSVLSSNKLVMMNTFTFAYSQEYTMQEMKSAEYERYVQYMQSGGRADSIMTKADWDLQIKIQGDMLIMPIHRVVEMRTCMVTDITVESDHHSFIGGDGFAVSNSAMGKQAVGIYMSNFNHRIDTMSHVLHYPQKPLVRTKLSKYTNSIALPTGINAIVAIMTHTGFNQEDSVMLNKSAIDRGLFTSTYFKSYRDQCSKNHSTGEEEIFTKPVVEVSASGKMKPFNYDKLGPDGFIPKNVYVDSHDILVGKVMPQKVQSVISERDTSLQVKGNDDGHVDLNYQGINGDGYKFCKIRMRKYRKPQIGDKLACYSADHEYLTTDGWVSVDKLTLKHRVATMVDERLIYQHPSELHEFDYNGEMICVKSNHVDLCVTPNHRMLYRGKQPGAVWRISTAAEIYGKRHKYKKNVDNWTPDINDQEFPWHLVVTNGEITHFRFEEYTDGNGKLIPELKIDINNWLTFYGIYIAEGNIEPYSVHYAAYKPRVQEALDEAVKNTGLKMTKIMDKGQLVSWRLWCTHAVRMIGTGHIAITKSLQDWVWWLTREQSQKLVHSMCLGDGGQMENGTWRYYTSSTELANDFQRLCLHAGYSCNKKLKEEKGHTHYGISHGKPITCNADYWVLTIITAQNEPLINKYIPVKENQYSKLPFDGKVYCCTVPLGEGIVYVRRNGHPIWSGQSRSAQKGTIGMVYRHQDMPFTKDGISPDIIMNPHAIPSRMTIGQLMECIMGKACCHIGAAGDSTPFTDCSVESIANILGKSGYERYGNEILYNGRTGEQMKTEIFIGPTYYQRLKHMVADKSHCLTMDHEVLTANGWKFFPDITKEDLIATLKDGKLIYDKPIDLLHFPEYEGKIYHISNQAIDLDVTENHRMWVSLYNEELQTWGEYLLKQASEIIGKTSKYLSLTNDEIIINSNSSNQKEFMYNFKGPVFCLQVPSEVFMVRKNGKSVWTGNSRGSNGPIVLLTRQPAEGRARNGGLRFGEMERDAIVAHGASAFLKERMLDVSDNFRVFICRQCGLICTANPEKNIYKCSTCKNNADITQVRIPYAMKLLIQELMTMGVAPRITV